ncbi:proline-rich family protein [Striga hermonthica]|uniref:Proline-rich family protein n=1 Tax=Striga hermonthica TaxID=68872 RepID=A0A9N7R9P8_STRHE|nr:proline-rich family protein [Striga hermonthica]
MCPSTPPPPDASSAVAYAASRPVLQNPSPVPPPPNPHPFYSPPPSRLSSNPNPNFPQLAPRHPHPHDPPHSMYPLHPPGNPGFFRPNHLPHVIFGSGPGPAGNASGVIKGIPVSPLHHPMAGPPSTSISDNNAHNSLRDRNRDDTLAVVKDRKVRITDNASLYALCRSWLRNGFPEEFQKPTYLDTVKSLPQTFAFSCTGFKHFSHPHNLSLHYGPKTRCSGSKSARPGPLYACLQCNYFLNEHCFRAARTLNHPLTLVSCPTYQSASFFCNDCSFLGTGFCYAC